MINDNLQLGSLVKNYFNNFYSSLHMNNNIHDPLLYCFPSVVTMRDNKTLPRHVIDEEVKGTKFSVNALRPKVHMVFPKLFCKEF